MKAFVRAICYTLAALAALSNAINASAQQDVITTVVGGGPNGIPALNANVYGPTHLAFDAQGNYYFGGYSQSRVFKVTPGGVITVVAGNGISGYGGDGGLAINAQIAVPYGVAVDSANPANVYFSDPSNCLVRRVNQTTGVITTVAGLVNTPDGSAPYPTCGFGGDGGKANAAELNYPLGIAINPSNGDLYIAEWVNGRVRKVAGGTATGIITTFAGGGGDTVNPNNCGGSSPYGDTGSAKQAYLCYPQGLAIDTTVSPANVFISESYAGTYGCDVREVVGSSGKIYEVAGSYSLGCGFTDGVTATSGQFYNPDQLAVRVSGSTTTITVADFYNYRVRQFTLSYTSGVPKPGNLTTIAGDGGAYSGDGGPALSAGISNPAGVAFDVSGNLYLAGQNDNRVRKVTKSTGNISTVAGWGGTSYSDPLGISGVPGGGVSLSAPQDVFADPLSTKLYIGGYLSQNVYLWDSATTKVSNLAGNGTPGYAGDGTAANASGTELYYPQGAVRDSAGNVFIADAYNCVIRRVNASDGKIHTVVGGTDGTQNGCGYGGDGGPATAAQIYVPQELTIDAADNLYLTDYSYCLVRKVSHSTGLITTVAGLVTTPGGVPTAGNCGFSGDGGKATSALLNNPAGIAVDGQGNLYIAEVTGSRIRKVDAFTGLINTLAGDGYNGYNGDGAAREASLYNPYRVAADVNGNVFIGDYNNNLLRWVDPAGQVTTFAGSIPGSPQGSYGFGGDGGPALSALLGRPVGVTQDSAGNFYFADQDNNRIRKITAFAGYGRSTDSLSFGDQATGTAGSYQSIYLSAIGPVTINSITAPTGFAEIDDCAGASLTAGQTCEVDVAFAPTKTGVVEGTLSISSNAFLTTQANTVTLDGHGIGLTLSGSLAFGTNLLKTPVTKTVTLANSGATLTLGKIYLTQTTDFTIAGGTCPATGGKLATGANCTINVTFNSQTIGAKKSTLVVPSNDPTSPLLAGATGNGSEVKLSSATLAFPATTFGTTEVLNLTVTNLGTNTLTITPAISGTGAAAFTVLATGNTCTAGTAAGKSCVLPVQFKPAAIGSFAGSLTLTTNGGTNPIVALTGSDTTAVSVSAATLAFGNVFYRNTSTLNVTVNNLGTRTLTVASAISGAGAASYSVLTAGNTCTAGVAAGKSCVLPVQFKPAAVAAYSASLTLTTNGGVNPVVTLTGTGLTDVSVTPASISFVTITHGTNETTNLTIKNLGTASLTVSTAFSGTGAAAYSISTTGNTCTAAIAGGASCTLPIKFAPPAAVTYVATLTLTTNGGTNPAISLTGAGK